jgi:N-hydroxyarylamine O-acetyltransferase
VDLSQAQQYLARIGADFNGSADAESLRGLQLSHLLSVPFENLSLHLGEPIVLAERPLFEKLVVRRRGGFCYELNGAFAALLSALGYPVTLLAARVYDESGWGPPYDHLALRVDIGQSWLVDVGFGRFSHYPLRIDTTREQADPGGTFAFREDPDGDLVVSRNGRPEYRMELRSRELADFEATCWWQQTSPRSHFTRSLVCSLLTRTGHVTLGGRTLKVTENGEQRETVLETDAEVLDAYRERFGIELDRVPEVRPGRAG